MGHSQAAWERAMQIPEVILRALSGGIHWFRRRRFWAAVCAQVNVWHARCPLASVSLSRGRWPCVISMCVF